MQSKETESRIDFATNKIDHKNTPYCRLFFKRLKKQI